MGRGPFILYALLVLVVATFINLALSGGLGSSSRGWSSGSGSGWSSGGFHK
jgi:hypothetical protein